MYKNLSGYAKIIWRGTGEKLFLAFLMTIFSQPFFPFMGSNFMSFSFLTARHTQKILVIIKKN
ncbi:hypothetical protein [Chitinophaga caeni]|uniref:hypothetical protein n=1 Tax=Chitinophaga caeni TaxID=2029983 RepID=UPI0018E0B804|nr:hypothetical protein [Chitinophaga caeni]